MELTKIGKLSLKNHAGIVTRIRISYMNDEGEKELTGDCTEAFPVGLEYTVDPGDCGVPDGKTLSLYAWVAAGEDLEAERSFHYEKGNPQTAHYVITGTALGNNLGLVDIS